MALDRAGPRHRPILLARLRLYEHVFRGTATPVVVAGLDKRIAYANPAAERLLGWQTGELLGQSAAVLTATGAARIDLDALLEGGESWSGERLTRAKDDTTRPTRTTVTVLRGEGGEPLGFVGILADDAENQRYRARLASLLSIGAGLNAERDPSTLLLQVCRDARALFQVDGAYLSRVDDKTGDLVGLVADGFRAESWPGRRIPLAEEHWASTAAARQRQVVIRAHVGSDERDREYYEAFQVRSALATPLLHLDRLLGVLAFTDTQRPDRFGPEDADLAGAYGALAAVALEGARLHEAARARSERLLALARVSELLTASLERGAVLETIVDGALRLLDADAVRIWLLETADGPFRPACHRSPPESPPPAQLDFRHSRMGEAVRTGHPWQTPDLSARPELLANPMPAGLRGCLLVPLIAEGRPLGGLTILTKEVRVFGPEDVGLAMALGYQAALAVHNAETLARERQATRLERLLERARLLGPDDAQHVEQILAAAERVMDLGTAARGG